MTRSTKLCTVLALVTTSALAWGAAPAAASGWSQVPIPKQAGLLSVSGTSTTDVWAVGYIYNQMFAVYRPVAMHSSGGAFVDTTVPRKGRGYRGFNAGVGMAPNGVWGAGHWKPERT